MTEQAASVLEAAKKEVERLREELKKTGGVAAQLEDAREELDRLSKGLGKAGGQLSTVMERLDGFVEQIDKLDPASLDETMLSVADRVSRIEDNVRKMEQLSLGEVRKHKEMLDEISSTMDTRLKEAEGRSESVLKTVAESVRSTHDQAMQQWGAIEGRDAELSGQLEGTRKMVTAMSIFCAIVVVWVLIL
jgi:uncharacterized coiled-coil DUF342 family protein